MQRTGIMSASLKNIMYSLVVASVAMCVGVWRRLGCNWVGTGGAHKSAIKLCLPPETCKLYAKRKQLSTTGIWHLCEVNVNNNNNAWALVYTHFGVELYPKRAVCVCTRVLVVLIVTRRITAVAFGRRRTVPELST